MASDISSTIAIQVSPASTQPRVAAEPAAKAGDRQAVAKPSGENLPLPGQKEQPETPKQDLDQAVSQLNDYAQNLQRDLSFSVDELSGRTVIKVLDSESDEVIRQIPSEDMLAVIQFFAEQAASQSEVDHTGILLKEQV